MPACLLALGGVLYKWNSKKGNHIYDITDFLFPNVRKFFIIIYFSSEKCPIIFKAYNSQLVYMGKVIHSLQHISLFTTVYNRHCFDPEFHFSTYIAFNKSLFFFWRGIEILDWSWERLKLCVFFILNLVFYEMGLWLKACKNIFGLNWLFGNFLLCVCMPVYFWDIFNLWRHFLIITLWHVEELTR